ncbi:MAG TPA: DsbA family protein [Candidatus Saccharimonadales bacterium]
MNKKAWLIFGGVVVLVIAGLVYLSNKNKIDVSGVNLNSTLSANEQSGDIADHVFGKKDSKVILVEYGDFQCPGCGNAHPTVKKLSEKYKDQIAFVFRNFPLTNIHPNARAAAATAEAAGLQGKYWEMHNRLFESQNGWSTLNSNERTEFFKVYAKEFNLDGEKFESDLVGEQVNKKINYDRALAGKANVTSTPSFFLNGQSLGDDIWSDEAKFEEAILKEMQKQGIEAPKAQN